MLGWAENKKWSDGFSDEILERKNVFMWRPTNFLIYALHTIFYWNVKQFYFVYLMNSSHSAKSCFLSCTRCSTLNGRLKDNYGDIFLK